MHFPKLASHFTHLNLLCEATTNIINLYLGNEYVKDIAAIAKASDKKAELDVYVLEALRQFYNANNCGIYY